MSTETLTLAQEASALRELKLAVAEAKEIYDAAKGEADAAEIRLFERMDGENVQSLKVGGTNFVRAETSYGQIQDRSEFIEWAETNAPELVETRERKKLVNELVREYLDNGYELPPGVGFYVDQYISQRAG